MAVFDFAIRRDDEMPPLQQAFVLFGRISSTLCFSTFVVFLFHLSLFRKWSFFISFGIYNIIIHVVTIVDALVSNAFGLNIQNARKAGFSDRLVLLIMEFNFVASQSIGYFIVNYVVTDPSVYSWETFWKCLDLSLIVKVVVNLTLAELLFSAGHSLMHTHPSLVKLHILHHCSTFSSWNTNLLFHPIDLAIEFTGPALGLLGMHYFVWQDEMTMLVTYLIFLLWYAYDHDETLRLYHVQHHAACDSLYAIYTKVRGLPKHNLLKQEMKALSLQWPKLTRLSILRRNSSQQNGKA